MDPLIKRVQTWIAIFFLLSLSSTKAVEETQPEILLQPRNFNPHPYEFKEVGSTVGPVTFPQNDQDEQENLDYQPRSNFVIIPRESHPVDEHPYPKVAKKLRFKLPGRYHKQNHRLNPEVSKALARHGIKVLTKPVHELKDDYVPIPKPSEIDQGCAGKYIFSYKVVDSLTGDDFSHSQRRSGKATKGEYRVKLPDGRLQIVSYTADKNGYKADVSYETEPKQEYVTTPTAAPPLYLLSYRQPKVQIYTSNARDYFQGSYVPITDSPQTYHRFRASRIEPSTLAPLVKHQGNQGLLFPTSLQQLGGYNSNDLIATTSRPFHQTPLYFSTTASPLQHIEPFLFQKTYSKK